MVAAKTFLTRVNESLTLVAVTATVVVLASAFWGSALGLSWAKVGIATLLGTFCLASLLRAALLHQRVVRPSFLMGWSVSGSVCTSLAMLLWLGQSLFRVAAEPKSLRWLPLCLFAAAIVLHALSYARLRRARQHGS